MSMTLLARRITPAQLAACKKKPSTVLELFASQPKKEGWTFDDQMYAAINHCATGEAWSTYGAGAAILGGKAIGPKGNYGPARYIEPKTVLKIAAALAKVKQKKFVDNFDADAMNEDGEIYPPVEPGDDELLWERFCALRELYEATADAGDALLLYVE